MSAIADHPITVRYLHSTQSQSDGGGLSLNTALLSASKLLESKGERSIQTCKIALNQVKLLPTLTQPYYAPFDSARAIGFLCRILKSGSLKFVPGNLGLQ